MTIPKSNAPPAIKPVYRTAKIDAPIVLSRSLLNLKTGKSEALGRGTITLKWRPFPHIDFIIEDASNLAALKPTTASLKLGRRGPTVSVRALLKQFGPKSISLQGLFREPICFTRSGELQSVIFHLANFVDYHGEFVERRTLKKSGWAWPGRLSIEVPPWRIDIDSIPNKKLFDAIRKEGGFAITHAGQLARLDRNSFTREDASAILEDLGLVLSFVRGAWSIPFLRIGYDATGRWVWKEWEIYKQGEGRALSWFDEFRPEGLGQVLRGLVKRRQNAIWKMPLEIAVGWHCESSSGGGTVETALILQQAALELLASTLLVDQLNKFTANDFDWKVKAHEKVRSLLTELKVPTSIPNELDELQALAKVQVWNDGPRAFTEMRNSVVHSSKLRRLLAASTKARLQARHLGAWYLEMSLLALCDYQGNYKNRLLGNPARVPWA